MAVLYYYFFYLIGYFYYLMSLSTGADRRGARGRVLRDMGVCVSWQADSLDVRRWVERGWMELGWLAASCGKRGAPGALVQALARALLRRTVGWAC